MKKTISRTNINIRLAYKITLLLCLILIFPSPKVQAAGTKTWSNTDCSSGSNCSWSDTNNWIGGIVPGAGDDIVFDNNILIPANSPTNDISGLAINNLSFINAGSGANTIVLGSGLFGGDLTVNTAISQSASATTANFIKGTLKLGGNVTVTGNGNNLTLGSSSAGQANDIIQLNGHTLNLIDVVVPGSTPKLTINDIISNTGIVTYNGAHTQFVVKGVNTYSGTTNVTASSSWIGADVAGQQPFGTSTIVVSSVAGIKFNYLANTSITNPIRLTGGSATSGLPISIYFANSGASSITYTVPNITLLGNVSLSNDTLALVNLTGITTSGYCIEYLTAGTLSNTPYTGGPGICVTPVSPITTSIPLTTSTPLTLPRAPNTGVALISVRPLGVILSTIAAATVLIVTVRLLGRDKP